MWTMSSYQLLGVLEVCVDQNHYLFVEKKGESSSTVELQIGGVAAPELVWWSRSPPKHTLNHQPTPPHHHYSLLYHQTKLNYMNDFSKPFSKCFTKPVSTHQFRQWPCCSSTPCSVPIGTTRCHLFELLEVHALR
jgi:hypothetical protein